MGLPKRTQKDELEYDNICRAENTVLQEIVKVLRREVKQLRENQVALFQRLIDAEDNLRIYRVQHLTSSEKNAAMGDAVPGFYWDTVDGWHRDSDKEQA